MPVSLTLNSTGVVVVDDTSSIILYQGIWQTSGVREEYNFTTHGASIEGSTATFLFNGTSVAVYGTLGFEGTPVTTYNLDDSSLVKFEAPSVQVNVHHTLFYQSPDLSNGDHRLVITNLHNNGVYWLDYLLYMPSPSPSTSVITQSSIVPPVTTSASATSAKTNVNVGALAGGIVGGLALATIIVALLFFWRHRSPKKKTFEEMTPFVVPVAQAPYVHNRPSQPSPGDTYPGDSTSPSHRGKGRLSSKTPVVDSRPHHSIDQSSPDNRSHLDTGVRDTAVGSEPPPNVTRTNDSVYSSPVTNLGSGVHFDFKGPPQPPIDINPQNSYLGQQDGQSDIRTHQDGGTRIAGGPSDVQQPFSPSRDIPPAYDRF